MFLLITVIISLKWNLHKVQLWLVMNLNFLMWKSEYNTKLLETILQLDIATKEAVDNSPVEYCLQPHFHTNFK